MISATARGTKVPVAVAVAGCRSKAKDEPEREEEPAEEAPATDLETSVPTADTVAAYEAIEEPVTAFIFADPGAVRDQIYGFLTDLGERAGEPLEIRELDRLGAPSEAKRYRVRRTASSFWRAVPATGRSWSEKMKPRSEQPGRSAISRRSIATCAARSWKSGAARAKRR